MELQEDAWRLQQVLPNVSFKDIVLFLRQQVPASDTDIQCQVALQHFLEIESEVAKYKDNYQEELNADFLCLKHLFPNIPDDEIRSKLDILGSIRNRKLVAAKLLLHENNSKCRKRKKTKNNAEEFEEASSSKQIKIADSTNQIPKLIFRRDRNSNEFVINQVLNFESEPTTSQAGLIDEVVKNGETNSVEANIVQNEILEEAKPSSTILIPAFEAPGPSGQGWKDISQLEAIPGPSENDDTIIDLSVANNSLIFSEEIALGQVTPEENPILLAPADEKLVLKIIEMFPDASPNYIRRICAGKIWSEEASAEVIEEILSNENYPRRPEREPSPEKQLDPEEQLSTVMALLPDASPSFLRTKIDQLGGNQNEFQKFIEDAVENRNYPTMKDYLRQQQLSAQQRQYTTEFQVERFVELFPDPVAVFEDRNRKTTILNQMDKSYVKWFMRNKYSKLYAKVVNSVVEKNATVNMFSIIEELDKHLAKGCLKKTKCFSHLTIECQNIPLLQELAYFEHKHQILEHLETKKTQLAGERENAKKLGLFQECSCCFDEEVMPCDILTCTGGCRFCRVCIRRSTEVVFGEGKVNFPCFSSDCDAEFSLQVLQNVLPPKLFSKLAQKKTLAEVKAAGMEDLEMCPFCDFANIPAPEDKLFRCLNPECMKESCRLCKEPSHVPLRCEEVEKDEAIKARTYIENKMTEALIRECWKCGTKFIKEEGCNKMTCSCGAMMCYICRKPVKDYTHFNGQGGDQMHLCPLYTDNFSVNEKNVLQAAEQAKNEIDPTQLKNDPTADLQKHFADKIKSAERKTQQLDRLLNNMQLPHQRLMMINVARRHQRYAGYAEYVRNRRALMQRGRLQADAQRARLAPRFNNIELHQPRVIVNPPVLQFPPAPPQHQHPPNDFPVPNQRPK